MPVRKTGAPFALGEWKLEALLQIFYRVGKGMKKYRALELVSEAIGQSADTIRDWEKGAKLTDPLIFQTTEKVCASALFCMTISPNLSMRGRNRGSGMLGISS